MSQMSSDNSSDGSLLVIVPSRGRPGAIAELIGSFQATIEDPGTKLWVCVDYDDHQRRAYQELLWAPDNPKWARLKQLPRKRLGPTLNDQAHWASKYHNFDVIGFMGDDHRPRTKGWDVAILNALKDVQAPGGVAYGNDLIHGPNIPTAAFQSKELILRLGYFNPPEQIHLFLDNYWKMLGEETTLRYLPEVIIEHLHPIAGKGEWDEGYRENNSSPVWEHDEAAFNRYMKEMWPTERLKLK